MKLTLAFLLLLIFSFFPLSLSAKDTRVISWDENLQNYTDRLERAERITNIGHWEFNLNTNMVTASEGAKEIYGLSGNTWNISEIQTIPLPEYRPILNKAMQDLISGKAPYDEKFKIRRPTDGEILSIHSIAEYNPATNVIFGTILDISEYQKALNTIQQQNRRTAILVIAFISILLLVITSLIITLKQRKKNIKHIETAMKELHESRKLLSNVLNTIPVRVFWKDKDLVYLGCNTSFARDAGFSSPEDIIGKDDYAFVWADTFADDFRKDDEYVIESGTAKLNYEEKIVTSNGEIHHLITSKVPLRNTQGKVIGMLGTYEDISEQKKIEKQKELLQEQLIQAQKLESIGRLAGGIAHDFNNMLGVIIGHAGLLLQMTESLKDENVRSSLKEIEFAANRSTNLTKQLMAYARKQPIHPVLVDMNEEIAGIHNMLQRLIGEQIVFRWQPSPQPLPIKIDPSQFDQIMVNLTVNARKAITGNGTISISTDKHDMKETDIRDFSGTDGGEYPDSSKSLAVLTIQDSGAGMDEHTKEHLFEPFYTTREVGEGTGLGMAMVYGAVKQNNGLIYIDSELGKGSTITIFFPIDTADGDLEDTAETGIHTYLDTGLTEIGNVQGDESGSSHEVSLHENDLPMPKGTETVLFAEDESSFQHCIRKCRFSIYPATLKIP